MDDAMLKRVGNALRAIKLNALRHYPRGSAEWLAIACEVDELNVAIAALDD